MPSPFEHESTVLPKEEALAFAPIHKRHFGTAIGLAAALLVGGVTIFHLLVHGPDGPLNLLNQYFVGYTVSWKGAVIGALWAFFVGWIGGWFVAFCRNFVLAATVFWVRAKTNLQASREFLDHI